MRLIFTIDRDEAMRMPNVRGEIPCVLFDAHRPGIASAGSQVRQAFRRWPGRPSQEALDLLSVALAVTVADRVIFRDSSIDRWSRDLELVIPVVNPLLWHGMAPDLEDLLRFISGDRWNIRFTGGGMTVGRLLNKRRVAPSRPTPSAECLCLFSGGMDSLLGAAELVHEGRRPLLISQFQPGEQCLQRTLCGVIGVGAKNHFATNPYPRAHTGGLDTSQRSRSFFFVALAVAAGSASGMIRSGEAVDLFIPENGFIALNAPLTSARAGSCSTRTVHPRTMAGMQKMLDLAGIPFALQNPYAKLTKGEMLAQVLPKIPSLQPPLSKSISCGAYRRNNFHQCGYCVPCLIRRGAFYRGGIQDNTPYLEPQPLSSWRRNSKFAHSEHLAAFELAMADEEAVLRRLRLSFKGVPLDQWSELEDVHTRGLHEVQRAFSIL